MRSIFVFLVTMLSFNLLADDLPYDQVSGGFTGPVSSKINENFVHVHDEAMGNASEIILLQDEVSAVSDVNYDQDNLIIDLETRTGDLESAEVVDVAALIARIEALESESVVQYTLLPPDSAEIGYEYQDDHRMVTNRTNEWSLDGSLDAGCEQKIQFTSGTPSFGTNSFSMSYSGRYWLEPVDGSTSIMNLKNKEFILHTYWNAKNTGTSCDTTDVLDAFDAGWYNGTGAQAPKHELYIVFSSRDHISIYEDAEYTILVGAFTRQ